MSDKLFAKIFKQHEGHVSDKWEQYLAVYDIELHGLANSGQPVSLLEIGVDNGGSLQLWKKFLPIGSSIVGIDIDERCRDLYEDKNIEIIIADATRDDSLRAALEDRTFDIIIDDGSHKSADIIKTFQVLFGRLRQGGKYFVEDLHTGYWAKYGGGFRREGSAVEWGKNLVDALNYDHIAADAVAAESERARLKALNRDIARITFYDSLLVIEKSLAGKESAFKRVMTGLDAPISGPSDWFRWLDAKGLGNLMVSGALLPGLEARMVEELGEARSTAAALRSDVAQLDAEVRQRTEDVSRQQKEHAAAMARLTLEAAGRAEDASRLAAELERRGSDVARLKRELEQCDAELLRLRNEDERRENEFARLQAEMQIHDDRRSRFATKIEKRERKLAWLSAQLAERNADYAQMRRSASWRLTAPAREIRRGVLRLTGSKPKTMEAPSPAGEKEKGRELPLRSGASLDETPPNEGSHPLYWTLRFLYRLAPLPKPWKRSVRARYEGFVQRIQPPSVAAKKGLAIAPPKPGKRATRSAKSTALAEVVEAPSTVATRFRVTATERAPEYTPDPPEPPARRPVQLIAFYLPQFHPIPENDQWWGRGFTEWTNVSRAQPQFAGHYQPHLPSDLGFYDLRTPATQSRQVELATAAGIGGFCFYFYWFGGRTLLEQPVRHYLENAEYKLPFCLCWANENWTRRWDGRNQSILIDQKHSPEDDIEFIKYVAEYFRDPRYIRVGGKPLLLVYHPKLLPDARATAARWRNWCRQMGLGEIHLAYTQSHEIRDPAHIGFDIAIEFPPNLSDPRQVNDTVKLYNPEFSGKIYDWTSLAARSASYAPPRYPLWRGVCPSWDNEARIPGRGTAFIGSSPQGYQDWLKNACEDTISRFPEADQRLVFINAWNEWAEGAHLEPDQRYGHAWLHATRNALEEVSQARGSRRIIVVSHDAFASGAQLLALNIIRTLAQEFGFAVATVLLGPGRLKEDFERIAPVHDLSDVDPSSEEAWQLAEVLFRSGYEVAIANTTVSGRFVEALESAGIRCVSLVHEMSRLISDGGFELDARAIVRSSATIIFGAEQVRDSFATVAPLAGRPNVQIRPQGLYKSNRLAGNAALARKELRVTLGVEPEARIVLGAGHAHPRKGVDIFIEACLLLAGERSDVHFVWVGSWTDEMRQFAGERLKNEVNAGRFHFVGYQKDTDIFFAGSDVYALTSREDPLPSVAFEALDVGVPVVAFAGTGGIPPLIDGVAGIVVPSIDARAFAAAVGRLLDDPERAAELGRTGRELVQTKLSWTDYVFDLLDYAGVDFKRVSVIVPNYNYAAHLRARLATIFEQTYPIFEVIVLDDASTDASLEVVEKARSEFGRRVRLVVNERNSGSAFAQWRKGLSLARGEYVWIAEADDVSSPDFLDRLVRAAEAAGAALAFSDSFQIDERDRRIGNSYARYCNGGDDGPFNSSFSLAGRDFLSQCLSVKNTILNVSSVLWRHAALERALRAVGDALSDSKVAGDWRLYSEVALSNEPIAYVAEPLNGHRRHSTSVTHALDKSRHHAEIVAMHDFIAERLAVNERTLASMRVYEREIAGQFGLEADFPEGAFAAHRRTLDEQIRGSGRAGR